MARAAGRGGDARAAARAADAAIDAGNMQAAAGPLRSARPRASRRARGERGAPRAEDPRRAPDPAGGARRASRARGRCRRGRPRRYAASSSAESPTRCERRNGCACPAGRRWTSASHRSSTGCRSVSRSRSASTAIRQTSAPVALGAVAYTVGAVAYLQLGEPDRGDLPLALAISSLHADDDAAGRQHRQRQSRIREGRAVTAIVGLLSIPVAIVAARQLDLDPGDMQLVRDAGFWGLVLGTTGMLAFGGSTGDDRQHWLRLLLLQGPSDRKVSRPACSGSPAASALGTLGAAQQRGVAGTRARGDLGRLRRRGASASCSGASATPRASAWPGITVGALAGLARHIPRLEQPRRHSARRGRAARATPSPSPARLAADGSDAAPPRRRDRPVAHGVRCYRDMF